MKSKTKNTTRSRGKTIEPVKREVLSVDVKDPPYKFTYNQMNNWGFNFALLGNDMRILHSPFMCKDYVQDIFWSENTGKDAKIYGISWSPGRLNPKSKRFRLALMGGDVTLSDHAAHLEKFLNFFDKAQGIDESIVYTTDDPSIIVVEFSNKWTKCGPMISALTTLIRVAGAYKGEDPADYLKNVDDWSRHGKSMSPNYMAVEAARLISNLEKLLSLLGGKKIPLDWSASPNVNHAHNYGILLLETEYLGGSVDDEDDYDDEEDDDEYDDED